MARDRWHILRDDTGVTVARHLPARFDLAQTAWLACRRPVSRLAVAQQVRQDLWRAMRGVPGFSPVVRVERDAAGLSIRAGGRLARGSSAARARVAAVLDDRAHQARWIAHAGRRAR